MLGSPYVIVKWNIRARPKNYLMIRVNKLSGPVKGYGVYVLKPTEQRRRVDISAAIHVVDYRLRHRAQQRAAQIAVDSMSEDPEKE